MPFSFQVIHEQAEVDNRERLDKSHRRQVNLDARLGSVNGCTQNIDVLPDESRHSGMLAALKPPQHKGQPGGLIPGRSAKSSIIGYSSHPLFIAWNGSLPIRIAL